MGDLKPFRRSNTPNEFSTTEHASSYHYNPSQYLRQGSDRQSNPRDTSSFLIQKDGPLQALSSKNISKLGPSQPRFSS